MNRRCAITYDFLGQDLHSSRDCLAYGTLFVSTGGSGIRGILLQLSFDITLFTSQLGGKIGRVGCL